MVITLSAFASGLMEAVKPIILIASVITAPLGLASLFVAGRPTGRGARRWASDGRPSRALSVLPAGRRTPKEACMSVETTIEAARRSVDASDP